MLYTYHFEKTYTDKYYFEVQAHNREEADEKIIALQPDDADGKQNVDVVTDFIKAEAIEDDEDNFL